MSKEIIIKSPAPPVEAPKGNFVNVVFRDINKWWMNPAIECSESGVMYTYSELFEQIKQWCGFLKDFGLTTQDSVMIISPNCLQYVPICFGTISSGISLSLVKSSLTSSEIKKLAFNIRSKFIIYSIEAEDIVSEALKENISNFKFFSIGKPMKLKALNVDDILYGKEFISSCWPQEVNGEETAIIYLSSGTTGTPKAAEISHNTLSTFLYNLANPYHDYLWKTEELSQSISMGMAPFCHISGLILILSAELFSGAKVVIFPRYSRDALIDGIGKHKITRMFIPPSILNLMIDSSNCTEETVGSLNTMLCGSAPVLRSSVEAFRRKFTVTNIIEGVDCITSNENKGYGMNEVAPVSMMPRSCKNLFGCGRLVSNIEAKILCTKTGKTLGPNERGEICIKSPSIMKGYLNNQKATDEILKNGWIHTGDIGYYDEDEFFFVTDRIKDLIKVDGCQVSPCEIENELQKHPLVDECCVIGKPDAKYGELPFAFVIPKEKVTKEELQNFLKDKLADFKQLRGGINFVETLPKNETGKFLKRELRKKI